LLIYSIDSVLNCFLPQFYSQSRVLLSYFYNPCFPSCFVITSMLKLLRIVDVATYMISSAYLQWLQTLFIENWIEVLRLCFVVILSLGEHSHAIIMCICSALCVCITLWARGAVAEPFVKQFLVSYPQPPEPVFELAEWPKLTYLVLMCHKTPINQ